MLNNVSNDLLALKFISSMGRHCIYRRWKTSVYFFGCNELGTKLEVCCKFRTWTYIASSIMYKVHDPGLKVETA